MPRVPRLADRHLGPARLIAAVVASATSAARAARYCCTTTAPRLDSNTWPRHVTLTSSLELG